MERIEPGTLMVIAGNSNNHEFAIGETVRVKKTWGFDEYECEHLCGRDYWYVKGSDMVPAAIVEPQGYVWRDYNGVLHLQANLSAVPDDATVCWELGDELVKKVQWLKKDDSE